MRSKMLKRIRPYLTEDLTTKLHKAMVLPLLDYSDTIYGTTNHLALSKLQRLQNRGATTIVRVPKDTPTQIVLKVLKWLPLTKSISYHTHILMYKCLNGLAPNYLSRKFKYINHCYNTRCQDKQVLYVSKTKLEITKRALAHHGAINWNTLPDYGKSAPSLNVFKSVVLKYMFSQSRFYSFYLF